MLGDGKWNSGDQGSFFKYQYGVLKLLESINAGIAGLPGIDYELIYTSYKATVTVGGCYNLGDFIQRVDIINAATGAITSTVWYDETLGTVLTGGCIPPIGNLTPYIPPSNITVNNPFNLEATQLLVKALLTTIDADTSNLDVLLSTRNAEATQLLIKALLTTIDVDTSNLDVLLSTRASAANQTTLGSQTTKLNDGTNTAVVKAASTPAVATDPALVVAISPNNAIPITLPTGVQVITSSTETSAGSPGTVVAGATSVGFTTDASFVGSINGQARSASTFYGFEAAEGKTLPAIGWTITAGSMLIDKIV